MRWMLELGVAVATAQKEMRSQTHRLLGIIFSHFHLDSWGALRAIAMEGIHKVSLAQLKLSNQPKAINSHIACYLFSLSLVSIPIVLKGATSSTLWALFISAMHVLVCS